MADHLRWGILGAAKFARDRMAPAIHSARGAVLAGLATSAPEKAQSFLEFAPHVTVFDTYDALLNNPEIDAVYIPLPNHMHVDWTLKALKAGKHVLTEKPMALSEDVFDALIAARDASGRLAAEAFMIVHHPQWHMARDLLRQGAIGQLVHVDGVFSYDNRTDMGNIRNRAETGGGGLRDIGIYTFGSARFVTDEEPTVVAAKLRRENGVDTFAHVTANFPSFTFNAVISMRMFPDQRMVFHGTGGVMTLTAPFNANVFDQGEIWLENNKMETKIHRFPSVDQYILQVESFGASVRTGAPYACPLEFSRGTQRMIDMVFAAGLDI